MTAVRNMLIVVAALLAAAPALAQTDPHHPADAASGTPAPSMQAPSMQAPPMQAPSMEGGRYGMMNMMNGDEDGDTSGGRMPMRMMGGRMMEMMAAHIDGWLAFLKTELKITDAQSAQWNAFADALRANVKGMQDMRASMMEKRDQPAALPDRLALLEKMLSAHLDAVHRLKAAADPLYASFSDEQKETAEEVLRPMGMMRGMIRGRGRG